MKDIEDNVDIEKIIREYLLIHGHDLDISFVGVDESMVDYMVQLAEIDYGSVQEKFPRIRRKEVLRQGKEFYDTYFRVHDVYYATERMVKRICRYDIQGLDDLIEKFNGVGKKMSPYKLPVAFKEKSEIYGYLRMLFVDVDSEEFLRRMRPYFSGIKLTRRPTIVTPSSYVHELGHLQVESNKGSIRDYNNSELLPIFLEFLFLLNNKELFNNNLRKRFNFLLEEFDTMIKYYYEPEEGITKYQMFLTSKYVVSLLKAFKLLELYISSDRGVKKEILKYIQNVFDKERTLEEMLEKLDVTMESSLDDKVYRKLLGV